MPSKPWLAHYDQGVPHTLHPYPERTLADVVTEAAAERPNHPALLFKGTRVSYVELDRSSNAFAAGLMELGVHKGDRVALLLPNCPQAVIALLGTWKAGAIAAPLNPLYTPHELEFALNDCGAESAVVLTSVYEKVKSLQPRTGLRQILATSIKEYLPTILRILFTLFKEKKGGHRIALQAGDLRMDDLMRRHAGASRPPVPLSADDPALLLFTGGTTGTPKAAIGTHLGLLAAGLQLTAWFAPRLDAWDDTIMLNMPLFHVYGNAGALAMGLVGHHPLALVPNPRDLDDLIATIREVRPAAMPGVPTLFNALLDHSTVKAGEANFKSMKACICGAAPLLLETKKRFEELTGGRIVEGYALTESMMACVVTPIQGTYKVGSAGIPLTDVEIRIRDVETGEGEVPSGDVGEILLRAPQLMSGYWQRPEETADALRGGWLHTGDLGYLDEDGYLFIVDRKKDLIKSSGFQVWPREVEEVIAAHPAVAEVGVAGVADEYQGEAVKAWIVLRPGQKVTGDDLRTYCRGKLVSYKVPKQFEFRESLPKSMVGKVLRRELARGPRSG